MVIDPGTAMLIATAVAAAAQAGGANISNNKSKKAAKLRSKEMKRETQSDVAHNAMQRSAELEAHRLGQSAKNSKKRAQSSSETSDLIRGAFKI